MKTYGQGLAAIILTANELGFETNFTDTAERILKGEGIAPNFIGHFEKEALEAKEQVLKAGLAEKADKIASQKLAA
jgi:hypothetical protein